MEIGLFSKLSLGCVETHSCVKWCSYGWVIKKV